MALKISRGFGGICRPYAQGRGISVKLRVKQLTGSVIAEFLSTTSMSLVARDILRSWEWRQYIPPKVRIIFDGIPSITVQKIKFFNLQSVLGLN
jgi:hypothetical protein